MLSPVSSWRHVLAAKQLPKQRVKLLSARRGPYGPRRAEGSEFGGMVRLLPRQRRAAHAPIHARGLSPLADWRASQETPRRGGEGVGVQATGSGSSPRGRAGSLQPVVHVRPGHSSESLPTPWLRTTPPPTAPGCRLSMASVAPGQAVTQDGTACACQILKYGYKKSMVRTKEGEVKWVPTKRLPSSSFATSACVVL